MAICSYLVMPAPGATDALAARLCALPGCEVARAGNRELLLLVTETASAGEEAALRRSLAGLEGIHALLLTFGEIQQEADGGAGDAPVPPVARRDR